MAGCLSITCRVDVRSEFCPWKSGHHKHTEHRAVIHTHTDNLFEGCVPSVCGAVALKTASAYGFLSAPLLTAHLDQFPAHLQHFVNKQGKL